MSDIPAPPQGILMGMLQVFSFGGPYLFSYPRCGMGGPLMAFMSSLSSTWHAAMHDVPYAVMHRVIHTFVPLRQG